jgi:hypothetical protein
LPILDKFMTGRTGTGTGRTAPDRQTANRLDSLEDSVGDLDVRVARIERALNITPPKSKTKPKKNTGTNAGDDRPGTKNLGKAKPGIAAVTPGAGTNPPTSIDALSRNYETTRLQLSRAVNMALLDLQLQLTQTQQQLKQLQELQKHLAPPMDKAGNKGDKDGN